MKRIICFSLLTIIACSSFKPNHSSANVKDYFSIPAVSFSQSNYILSWSAHPSDNYYKQEYLPAGSKAASFNKMIMIETVTGNIAAGDAVKNKLAELAEIKKTDPLANYQVIQNPKTGEYILDFILSQSAAGKTVIAEWNVYRYLPLNTGAKKGLVLFAYSRRGYGDGIPDFLNTLKTARVKDISTLSAYTVPPVKIKTD